MTCAYCGAPCVANWSPAENKSQRFPACDRQCAYAHLNKDLVLSVWRTP